MDEYRPSGIFFRAFFKKGVWPSKSYSTSIAQYLYNKELLIETLLEESITKRFENYIYILKFSTKKADLNLANAVLDSLQKEFKTNNIKLEDLDLKDKLIFFIRRVIYSDLDISLSKKAIDTLELIDHNNLKLLDKNRIWLKEVKDYLKQKLKNSNTIDF